MKYLFLFFLSILLFSLWTRKEGLDSSPYDFAQEQAGELQQLYDKVHQITLTEAYIDSLQSDNDQTTDQINQLQANMPTTTEAEAYPEE